jgi:hypothetical protein
MAQATRDVHLEPDRTYAFGDYQLNYMDYRTRRLIPSTRILLAGDLLYSTNALGCLGEEIAPETPVAAFFGDSCTHGYRGRSFVEQVAIDGCQPLNAGIEGLTLPWIADRFEELRDRAPIVAAAVHSGWHNIFYNERSESFWAAQLDRVSGVPVIAHYRLTADINADAVREGYDRAFTESYCRDRGRILIDLEPATAPQAYEDLGRAFLDFIHPHPDAYPAIAGTIEAALSQPVARALAARKAAC